MKWVGLDNFVEICGDVLTQKILGVVAGHPMVGPQFAQLWLLHRTAFQAGDGAAGMEAAAGGRVQWAGHVASQDGALLLPLRVGDGDGR